MIIGWRVTAEARNFMRYVLETVEACGYAKVTAEGLMTQKLVVPVEQTCREMERSITLALSGKMNLEQQYGELKRTYEEALASVAKEFGMKYAAQVDNPYILRFTKA